MKVFFYICMWYETLDICCMEKVVINFKIIRKLFVLLVCVYLKLDLSIHNRKFIRFIRRRRWRRLFFLIIIHICIHFVDLKGRKCMILRWKERKKRRANIICKRDIGWIIIREILLVICRDIYSSSCLMISSSHIFSCENFSCILW